MSDERVLAAVERKDKALMVFISDVDTLQYLLRNDKKAIQQAYRAVEGSSRDRLHAVWGNFHDLNAINDDDFIWLVDLQLLQG